jgi:YidC/Oxa1 family membrane protein insertase
MAGCLPMLLQFPIIIFLYNVIRNPLSHICRLADESVVAINNLVNPDNFIEAEKIAEKFKSIDQIKLVGMIRDYGAENINIEGVDLSRLPDFTLFGTNLGNTPSLADFSWLVLVPVIAAALTWLSMFLTRKWNSNPAQMQDQNANASLQMMDLMMPAMTLFMAFGFSSMMGIYWIYQSALGILQTFIISRAMPLPKFSEEDVKEFKKAQKEAEKNARTAAKNAPKVRSLHYIDDDDYENLPEANGGNKNTPDGQMDLPEI